MTKGRGGKRDNAGRKPMGDEALSSTIIARVTPEQKETFKANGGGQWLRCALTNLKESRLSIPAWAQAVMPVHHAAVPLFEYSVQAGFPSPDESYKETLDFNDLLMIDAGMCDGDLMVVDRSRTPKNNDIVVMQIDNDYTVKRFIKTSDGFYLKAENASGLYPDIYPKEGEQWMLFGVVNYVIKPMTSTRVA